MRPTDWAAVALEVHALWPQARWDEVTVERAGALVADLDGRLVLAAVHTLAAEGREFPPPPGVIRSRAVELASADTAPDVDQAWAEVRGAMATVGSWGVPELSHPAVAATVDAMGWKTLCRSEDQMADRAHFLRLYGAATARARRSSMMPPAVAELVASTILPASAPGATVST